MSDSSIGVLSPVRFPQSGHVKTPSRKAETRYMAVVTHVTALSSVSQASPRRKWSDRIKNTGIDRCAAETHLRSVALAVDMVCDIVVARGRGTLGIWKVTGLSGESLCLL